MLKYISGFTYYFSRPNRLTSIFFLFLSLTFSSQLTHGQFITRGDANKVTDKCYQITKNELYRFGIIWWKEKIDLSKPFELDFIITLGADDAGADGIALVFQDDPRGLDASGQNGLGLGYGSDVGNVISPSVAVEFDTFDNSFTLADIPADHTAIVYNGDLKNPKLLPVPINPVNPNVEDNQCHNYKITWDPVKQELKLFFDEQLRFSYKDDIINKVFDGNSQVYYGFTGSTGGSKNEQTICIPDPNNKPVAQDDAAQAEPTVPITIDALKNDSHTSGEKVGLSRIVTQPKNGTAFISNNTIVYTAKYGFTGTETLTYEICENSSIQCYSKCVTATVNITVTCPPQPIASITVGGPTTFCEGESVKLKASVGASYVWSNGTTTQEITATEAGFYTVKVRSAGGCEAISEAVEIKIKKVTPPSVQGNGRCEPGTVTLSASGGTNSNYRWYTTATGGTAIVGEVNNSYLTPVLPATTTFYVALVQDNCESIRVPVIAAINPLPLLTTSANVSILKGGSTLLLASGATTYTWSPQTGLDNATTASPKASPAETTVYTVTGTSPEGCTAQAQVTVTVQELGIPNAFSPNGDGVNDTWIITNILNFPNSQVQIFDRWGSKVHETNSYKNDWGGFRNGTLLPGGTYFYVITIDQSRKLTGSVSIIL